MSNKVVLSSHGGVQDQERSMLTLLLHCNFKKRRSAGREHSRRSSTLSEAVLPQGPSLAAGHQPPEGPRKAGRLVGALLSRGLSHLPTPCSGINGTGQHNRHQAKSQRGLQSAAL